MSTAARIDELRKKFEENPRRYFAPLANEYRKAGDLSQAIALCREHLPKQPGHMSGYIVFGQALYEAAELAEARSVFEQALDLDPENLIALRHLGDIARAHGDAATARRWYERVLDADPRNDDIAAQLATLSTGRTPMSSPAIVPSTATPAVPSSAQPFARVIETPPLGVAPVGLGAIPTPDSVMRAVDLDAFAHRGTAASEPTPVPPVTTSAAPVFVPNATPTPIDLDAIEDLGASVTSSSATPAVATPAVAMPDADAFGFPDVGEISLASAADADADAVAAPSPLEMPAADAAIDVGDLSIEWSTDGETDSPAMDSAEAFEEGLVAAEWPDTTEMVARRLTPRQPTPVSVTPQSLTPVAGEAVADAIAAFGAEPHEVQSATPELPIEVEPIAVSVHETLGVSETPALIEPMAEAMGSSLVESAVEPVAEPLEEPIVEAVADVAEPVAEALPWLAVPEAPVVSAEEIAAEQPGLEELAEVFADDARAAGVVTPVIVAAIEDPEPTRDVQSFADLAAVVDGVSDEMMSDAQLASDAPDTMAFFAMEAPASSIEVAAPMEAEVDANAVADEAFEGEAFADAAFADEAFADEAFADEAFEAHETVDAGADDALMAHASAESPAFVTETMAELLVSQGFIGRAADVYEELVRRRPFDPVLEARLTELRAMLAPETPVVASAELVETAEPEATSMVPLAFAAPVSDDVPDDVASTFADGVEASVETTDEQLIAASFEDPTFVPMTMPTPAYGTPAYGTPAFGASTFGTPAFSASVPEPLVTPPVAHHPTPYAQPAVDTALGRRTAREWFASVAARRVPRRTPAHAAPAIQHEPDGLSSLFGTDPVAHDDSAARALADAFAPISAQDLAGGSTLDFEYARATPAFGSVASATPVASPRVSSPTPAATFAPVPTVDVPAGGAGNAGFAFDKFFPDPATRRGTPAASMPGASMPTASDAPVTDDLAQFSAWLKGLGNT